MSGIGRAASADRAIRVSTAAAVLGVAVIAAYLFYEHAYAVVRAHGETGLTARLEPATVDGLVYSSAWSSSTRPGTASPYQPWPAGSSRSVSPPPSRRTWPTAGPTARSAPSSPPGPPPASSAATNSSYGSSEPTRPRRLARGPAANQPVQSPRRRGAVLRLVPAPTPNGTTAHAATSGDPASDEHTQGRPVGHMTDADRASGPTVAGAGQAIWAMGQGTAGWPVPTGPGDTGGEIEDQINTAAVAAYYASVQAGAPLSERKLARMFGKTSRRWARHRMTEASQTPLPALVGSSN